ncbi:hypothetical protein AB8B23_05875 [Leptotrichia sp. HSP-342]|uniref:Uncharacterized protein n=1 Tax=Leptotrichia mesophila TaxID=3239303 RepID=A0AB39VEP2_9FUSO
MLDVKRQFNSFAFSENKLYSSIFYSATLDEEYVKIIEAYKNNIGKI